MYRLFRYTKFEKVLLLQLVFLAHFSPILYISFKKCSIQVRLNSYISTVKEISAVLLHLSLFFLQEICFLEGIILKFC
jgi:hypothetical protein